MEVLIAHGNEVSRRALMRSLSTPDLRLQEAGDGLETLDLLLSRTPPRVALIDWDLPGIEGPELCRLVRDFHLVDPPYVILLAGPDHHHEIATGLGAGAHDCVRAPASSADLVSRVDMGRSLVELPWGRGASNAEPSVELEDALAD